MISYLIAMHRPWAALAAIALIAVVGCGGGGSGEAGDDQTLATDALITSDDFPAGTREETSVVSDAPCSPLPLMEGAQARESATFVVDTSSVQQVIGVFPAENEANTAFDSLASPGRRSCIRGTLRLYSSQQAEAGSTPKSLPPKSLDIGDEAHMMPFVIEQPTSPDLHIDAVLVRVGRAVTDLLFLSQTGKTPIPFIEDSAENAADRLSAALD